MIKFTFDSATLINLEPLNTQLTTLAAIQFVIIQTITSLTLRYALKKPGIAPQSAPANVPQINASNQITGDGTVADGIDKETINVTIAPIKYCPGAPILNKPVLNAIHADKPVRINGVALNNMLPNWNSELPPPENGPPRTMRMPRTASANPIRGLNMDSNTRTTNPTKIPPKIHNKEALSDFNPAEDFLFLFFIAVILLTITSRTSHV